MSRRISVAIAVITLAFAAAYLGSPLWAVKQFRAAAVSGDVDRLAAAVDFPAVREGLKAQVSAAAARRVADDPRLRGSPLAGLGVALMPLVVDHLTDVLVTPEGIAALIRQGRVIRGGGGARANPHVRYDYGYRGLDRFVVTVRAPDAAADRASRFVFARRGLFSWTLVRLEMPEAALAGEVS